MKITHEMALRLGIVGAYEQYVISRLKGDWNAAVHHYCCSFQKRINEGEAKLALLNGQLLELQKLLEIASGQNANLGHNINYEIRSITAAIHTLREDLTSLKSGMTSERIYAWWRLLQGTPLTSPLLPLLAQLDEGTRGAEAVG